MSNMVIGSGFGDEGKGKVVSYLCEYYDKPLVVRFCGGHQAGHHVMLRNGLNHVFSNFGSGTLQGIPTYWTKYCTVEPVGILNELELLKEKGIEPTLYIDEKCPVTTPFEKEANKKIYDYQLHGSCGVGFGQTIQREEDHFSILFEDLYYPSVLKLKLNLLKKYYKDFSLNEDLIDTFLLECKELLYHVIMVNKNIFTYSNFGYKDFIFEGSQGLLLDQNFGFFPHVTRSNTGSKNVIDMNIKPEVWLVTRAYQTRHGNGPMTNENLKHKIKDNPYEMNFDTTFQGKFRKSILDLDLIRYAINKDDYLKFANINLVITCVDLLDEYSFTSFGNKITVNSLKKFIEQIGINLNINSNLYISNNPYPELEKYE